MYKKMLVLLDGSKMSEVVFSYALEVSGRLGLDLELLHVCSSEEADQLPMRQAYIEHMAEMLKTQSAEIQKKTGISPGSKMIEAKGTVVVGYPAEEILKYADNNNIDIITLATHGSSGIRRWGLGSIADKVIHETNIPIWLVPAHLHNDILYDKTPDRTVLVPLDGSELAESIIPHVIALTKQRAAETDIVLVNVTKPSSVEVSQKERDLIGDDIASLRTAGQVYLDKIVKQFEDAGLKAEAEQLVGDPAEEIVRFASNYHPRLITISTHGRSGFSRFVFGSVAENVLRRLQKTPMFLVRPPH